jgi:hypothetical protein
VSFTYNTTSNSQETDGHGGTNFTIGGERELRQANIWSRVGNDGKEFPLSNNTGGGNVWMFTMQTVGADTATVNYLRPGLLTLSLNFQILDPGPALAVMAMTATFTNVSPNALTLDIFPYRDFDLRATAAGNTGTFIDNTHIRQSIGGGNPLQLDDVFAGPFNAWQIQGFPNLRNSLEDAAITNLNNMQSPFTGDVTFAVQYTRANIPAGGNTSFVETWTFTVPEPSTMALAGLGLVALAGYAWCRKMAVV